MSTRVTEPLDLPVQIENTGNTDLSEAPVTVLVSRTDSGEILAEQGFLVSLASQQVVQQTVEFDTQNWPLGNVLLQLRIDLGDGPIGLDSQVMAIVDRLPPQVTIESPQPQTLLPANFTSIGVASDGHSDVQSVGLLWDSQPPSAMQPTTPGSEQWTYAVQNAAHGEHTLQLVATDGAGNTAQSESITVEVDAMAPQIIVEGVASNAQYNETVIAQIQILDDHLQDSEILLNDAPYTSGQPIEADGEYRLNISAGDEVGNQSETTLTFWVDQTPPDVEITWPEDGSQTIKTAIDVLGQTESDALVMLMNTGESITADSMGQFVFVDAPLETGLNTLTVTAADSLGNVSEPAEVTVERATTMAVDGVLIDIPGQHFIGDLLTFQYRLENLREPPISQLQARVVALYDNQELGAFLAEHQLGGLATIKPDGQLSTEGWPAESIALRLYVRDASIANSDWMLLDEQSLLLRSRLEIAVESPPYNAQLVQGTTEIVGATSANTSVTLMLESGEQLQTSSDDEGRFVFSEVVVNHGPNTYYLRAENPRGSSLWLEWRLRGVVMQAMPIPVLTSGWILFFVIALGFVSHRHRKRNTENTTEGQS